MCRSKAEGGRRCPGCAATAGTPRLTTSQAALPPAAGRGKTRRAGARARRDQAQRALNAAKAAIGPPLGNPSYLLLGPLSRQAQHARSGGDPSVYDDQVTQGRAMLISLLASHGDSPATAAAKTEALASAYATWSATSAA